MNKIDIIDNIFAHAKSSSWYNESTNFSWNRNIRPDSGVLVLTDDHLNQIHHLKTVYPDKKYFAWLVESPSIKPNAINYIKKNYSLFEKVFTSNKELLEIGNNFFYVPIGGCWIEKKDRVVYNKTRLVSMIFSNKLSTIGHRYRKQIYEEYKGFIDFYGSGCNYFIDNKLYGLKDYKFTIVFENTNKDGYFTEKLIDACQTGTIPIYWGCDKETLNELGIDTIQLDNDEPIEHLNNIFNQIREGILTYDIDLANKNFVNSNKYVIADDLIYSFLKENEYL